MHDWVSPHSDCPFKGAPVHHHQEAFFGRQIVSGIGEGAQAPRASSKAEARVILVLFLEAIEETAACQEGPLCSCAKALCRKSAGERRS